MATILNLETATKNCSVGISVDGKPVAVVEEFAEKYIHSEKLHQFIQECLTKASKAFKDLDAIAVSNGPGSYTGLRIGVSAAKGLCYALNIPMIALNTNDILVSAVQETVVKSNYMSVIDARRNEVFARLYDSKKQPLSDIQAIELEAGMYGDIDFLTVIGDAANKTKELINHPNVSALELLPSAEMMAVLSQEKFDSGAFTNLAYHEPFYLKDFVAGKPRKLL